MTWIEHLTRRQFNKGRCSELSCVTTACSPWTNGVKCRPALIRGLMLKGIWRLCRSGGIRTLMSHCRTVYANDSRLLANKRLETDLRTRSLRSLASSSQPLR